MRTSLLAAAAACTLLTAPSAHAVVGGSNTDPGEYPAVAEVVLGKVAGCSGTLIAPQWVMTAGHCGSLTGGTVGVAQPVAKFPPQSIDVYLGSNRSGKGKLHPVDQVIVEPEYLLTDGYDVTLLHLAAPSAITPVPVANASERAIWEPADVQTIVGWGLTEEDGDAPDILQKAQVPVTTDQYCEKAYGAQRQYLDGKYGFENRTQVCAGYPEGKIDTCQGDSGGPMFARNSAGTLRLTGATSYGEGCAREGKPGVYARVADETLRTWIASVAPEAIAAGTTAAGTTVSKKSKKSAGKKSAAKRSSGKRARGPKSRARSRR